MVSSLARALADPRTSRVEPVARPGPEVSRGRTVDWPRDLRADVARPGAGRAVGASAATSGSRSRRRRDRAATLVRRAGARPRAARSRATTSATWSPGGAPAGTDEAATGVLTGSHLDSVLDGGAYDGPLGVVSALAAVDLLRERGFVPAPADRGRRVRRGGGVAVRPGLPRLAAGDRAPSPGSGRGSCATATACSCRTRWRPAGCTRTMRTGVGPARTASAAFVELHVEQGRAPGRPRRTRSGWRAAIWPHGRYRFDFPGQANHAGTTRMEDRHDPMLTYAMTALAANKQARLAGQRATFGRVEVDAQRHQRGALAGDRLARRPRRDRRRPGRAGRRRRAPGDRARRARRHDARRDRRVGLRRRCSFDPRPGAAHRRRPRGRRLADDPDPGRSRRRDPRRRPASRPRCCSCATPPASPTRPDEHAETADCLAGVDGAGRHARAAVGRGSA